MAPETVICFCLLALVLNDTIYGEPLCVTLASIVTQIASYVFVRQAKIIHVRVTHGSEVYVRQAHLGASGTYYDCT